MSRANRQRRWQPALGCGTVVVLLCVLTHRASNAEAPDAVAAPGAAPVAAQAAPAAANGQRQYDLEPRTLPAIPPGTVVADRAPEGWSQLILKSLPRITRGDVANAPSIAVRMAKLLSVCMLGKVQRQEVDGSPRYSLDRVAIGLATKVNGRDVVISSDTQAKLGADFGFIQRQVLSSSEEELSQIHQVARSSTMLVFDAPTVVVYHERHREMVVRHAVLVDHKTGRMFSVVWLIDKNNLGEYTTAVAPMSLLAPNTIEDHQLSVDSDQFTFGMPSATAIAMVSIPPGTQLDISDSLQTVAAASKFDAATAEQLEKGLHHAIREAYRRELSAQHEVRPSSSVPAKPRVQ